MTHAPPPRTKPTRSRRKSVPGARKVYIKRNRSTGTEVFYGDFREFADVGGRCEPLRHNGARYATSDLAEALAYYNARRVYYEARRAQATTTATGATSDARADSTEPVRLGPMLTEHLVDKARTDMRTGTLRRMEGAAHVLLDHLGNVPLASITPKMLQAYVHTRRQEPGLRKGSKASTASIRIELSLLSNALARAVAFGYIDQNPVPLIPDKPAAPIPRKVWLTRVEAGRLLDAGAEHDVLARRDNATASAWGLDPHAHEWQDTRTEARRHGRTVQWEKRRDDAEAILATLLYSGGRIAEVLGLIVRDVDFDTNVLTFCHNDFRRLKREWHEREIELWPALAATLRAHITRLNLSANDPLFPTEPGANTPVTRIDKLLARCCRRAGLDADRISPHALRHTFATMLLRTFTRSADGRAVQRSSFDAAKALGHGSSQLVDKVYGHPAREDCTNSLTYEAARQHPAMAR